jgi:ubiquitin-like 1-activating enzyme E1 A
MSSGNDNAGEDLNNNSGRAGPKRNESDVYDRQIRLWGADAQASTSTNEAVCCGSNASSLHPPKPQAARASLTRVLFFPSSLSVQAKMSQARVLYVHVTGAASEVLKNLVLAGIGADLCDPRPPAEAAESPSFFVNGEREAKRQKYATVADAIKPRLDQLNPLLDPCQVIAKAVDELTKEDVQRYTVVVASRISMARAAQLGKWVTEGGGAMYHTDSFGMHGACAIDLGPNRAYRPEKGKELLDETVLSPYVPLEAMYRVPFEKATNRFHKRGPPAPYVLWRALLEYVDKNDDQWPDAATSERFCSSTIEWVQRTSPSSLADGNGNVEVLSKDALRGAADVATAEIAPVCSVLGGLVGNEIIKVVSGKGEPANNTILFDGSTCRAYTFLVKANE